MSLLILALVIGRLPEAECKPGEDAGAGAR